MESRNSVTLFLTCVLIFLGYTYFEQHSNTKKTTEKPTVNIKSIKTNSYPKLDRKMFKAETTVRNALKDHENGFRVMSMSNTDFLDNQIKRIVIAKSRE